MAELQYVKGFTWLIGGRKCIAELTHDKIEKSLQEMRDQLGADTVMLAFGALMDHAHSEVVDWQSEDTPSDEVLIDAIETAKALGLRVFLKPMVNCRNGVWRAYISFIEPDVPCEPKWSGWFRSYTEYMVHYAKIAEETGCEMLMIGCEMVMAQHREEDWRKLAREVRWTYHGLLSINVDKYQEDNLTWWDEMDAISSSGYYPMDDWENQLNRIEAVVRRFNKPFFFAECGCHCIEGAEKTPNDWTLGGTFNKDIQTRYYEEMFKVLEGRDWFGGMAGWAWNALTTEPLKDGEDVYGVCGRPAAEVIRRNYAKR